jgi:hypothetical protein
MVMTSRPIEKYAGVGHSSADTWGLMHAEQCCRFCLRQPPLLHNAMDRPRLDLELLLRGMAKSEVDNDASGRCFADR